MLKEGRLKGLMGARVKLRSNLVREAWWSRERQEEKKPLILTVKKERCTASPQCGGVLLYVEDRCSAWRMMEVTVAPRLCWNDCTSEDAYPSLCSVSSKENSLCCWPVQSLDTRCECQPQDEEQLLWGWNSMAGVKILCMFACAVQWLWWWHAAARFHTSIWAEPDSSWMHRPDTNSRHHRVHSSHLKHIIQ